MIGLDTNVVVRFVMRDDPEQTPLADEVMSSLTARHPGYLSLIVLAELWWVLGRSYGRSRADRCAVLIELLQTDELRVQSPESVQWALSQVADGADFADALIGALARDVGCRTTVTFDRQASSRAGMALIIVETGPRLG